MRSSLPFALAALLVASAASAQGSAPTDSAAPRAHTASPSVHVLSDSFAIPQLGRTRRVWIYLPPDYAKSHRRYPVVYMHDGQNVFDAATSYVGEWGVDESLDSLRRLGDRGAIVVAVDHGGDKRLDELDPWKNANPKFGGGEGDAYVNFLVQTLKPYVDAHYRTLPDRRHTTIAGSSLGGLISLYAALKHPNVFGNAGVFSCACWIARPGIYALARRAKRLAPPTRFWFDVGMQETADSEQVLDQRAMIDTLVAAGYRPGIDLRAIESPDGKHSEWFWRREFPAAYLWLTEDAGIRVRKEPPTP